MKKSLKITFAVILLLVSAVFLVSAEECKEHKYTAESGNICTVCGEEYVCTEKSFIKTLYVKEDIISLRNMPYSICGKTVRTAKKGDSLMVKAYVTNSLGNRWYVLYDGAYVYSSHVSSSNPLNHYCLEFKSNADNIYSLPEKIYSDGNRIKIPTNIIPSREGYIFMGYSTMWDSESAEYQPGSGIDMKKDRCLYPVWEEIPRLNRPLSVALTADENETQKDIEYSDPEIQIEITPIQTPPDPVEQTPPDPVEQTPPEPVVQTPPKPVEQIPPEPPVSQVKKSTDPLSELPGCPQYRNYNEDSADKKGTGLCTLSSLTTLLQRAEFIREGKADFTFKDVREKNMNGMMHYQNYTSKGNKTYSTSVYNTSDKQSLAKELESHPEGVLVFCNYLRGAYPSTHAIVVTRYDGKEDRFYGMDPCTTDTKGNEYTVELNLNGETSKYWRYPGNSYEVPLEETYLFKAGEGIKNLDDMFSNLILILKVK